MMASRVTKEQACLNIVTVHWTELRTSFRQFSENLQTQYNLTSFFSSERSSFEEKAAPSQQKKREEVYSSGGAVLEETQQSAAWMIQECEVACIVIDDVISGRMTSSDGFQRIVCTYWKVLAVARSSYAKYTERIQQSFHVLCEVLKANSSGANTLLYLREIELRQQQMEASFTRLEAHILKIESISTAASYVRVREIYKEITSEVVVEKAKRESRIRSVKIAVEKAIYAVSTRLGGRLVRESIEYLRHELHELHASYTQLAYEVKRLYCFVEWAVVVQRIQTELCHSGFFLEAMLRAYEQISVAEENCGLLLVNSLQSFQQKVVKTQQWVTNWIGAHPCRSSVSVQTQLADLAVLTSTSIDRAKLFETGTATRATVTEMKYNVNKLHDGAVAVYCGILESEVRETCEFECSWDILLEIRYQLHRCEERLMQKSQPPTPSKPPTGYSASTPEQTLASPGVSTTLPAAGPTTALVAPLSTTLANARNLVDGLAKNGTQVVVPYIQEARKLLDAGNAVTQAVAQGSFPPETEQQWAGANLPGLQAVLSLALDQAKGKADEKQTAAIEQWLEQTNWLVNVDALFPKSIANTSSQVAKGGSAQ